MRASMEAKMEKKAYAKRRRTCYDREGERISHRDENSFYHAIDGGNIPSSHLRAHVHVGERRKIREGTSSFPLGLYICVGERKKETCEWRNEGERQRRREREE